MKNKKNLYISYFDIFLLIVFVFCLVGNQIEMLQMLNAKNEIIKLSSIENDLNKAEMFRVKNELAKIKNIDYEKIVTLSMLVCAGGGDKGEVSHKASFKDKKGIEQVIENRMIITGRTFYQEATAAYQFSPFNGKGLYINKYNIPRQAECIKNTIELISKDNLDEFEDATFFHAYGVNPKWEKSFHEVARTELHIFYAGDEGYKNAKNIGNQNKQNKQNKKNKKSLSNKIPITKKIKSINTMINN